MTNAQEQFEDAESQQRQVQRDHDRIGELHGRWALAFKASQVLVPIIAGVIVCFILPWCIWVSMAILQLEPWKERYGFIEAARAQQEMWERVDARFDALPPTLWQDRIIKLEQRQAILLQNQQRIMHKLEIETR